MIGHERVHGMETRMNGHGLSGSTSSSSGSGPDICTARRACGSTTMGRDVARLGLTDFRQQSNGDVAFVDLPEVGNASSGR